MGARHVDLRGLTLERSWYTEDDLGNLVRHEVWKHPVSGACIRIDRRG